MSDLGHFVIVVGIDFSELASRALDEALAMATTHEAAEVHAVYVQPDTWAGPPTGAALPAAAGADTGVHQVQRNVTEHVEKMPATLDKSHLRRVVAHCRVGSPADNIAQLAADLDADLVVVGSHGQRGLERFFLGSVSERVTRLSHCPVLIIRPKDHAAHVPVIEPACPDCLTTRRETRGASLWCARHSESHLRAHAFSYTSDGIYSHESSSYASTPL